MKKSTKKPEDSVQQCIAQYASALNYESLTPEAIHAAKVRVIDTLGALIGGFFDEACRVSRDLAATMPSPDGATVIGTRMKTAPDMAAFVNGVAGRAAEMMDYYHWPGSNHGHPSDTLMPVLAAGEYAHATGREFITGVVLAYEIYCRIADVFKNRGFDHTTFSCLASAVAGGKLLHLSADQTAHCISMAVVPNNILHQVRLGQLSMYKVAATGQAGRAGIFAALLARAGMEGPHLPFEGKAGWCDHVAGVRFSLDAMGSGDTPFKILHTSIKSRAAAAPTLACILAAEKVPRLNISDIKQVTVEAYGWAKHSGGTDDEYWNPQSRETADHSIPYVVAAALMDGTVTQRSYNDAHLWNPDLRALLQKIEVVENPEFTRAYDRLPVEHHARVTVVTADGKRLTGATGGGKEELNDAEIESKFRELTGDVLGAKRVSSVLDRVWNLENMSDVAAIPSFLVLD